ncbi:cupin domain-containing protein [Pusillimonas sp. TS35]|uniref:cupin domain-containing protein n=1 Tax=Paracandidimonas lactea TaxID=2895524 RepID=UPI00136D8ECC|nr:cupin domain-containing protein [Paracandidimonas lactea]MYN13339.1 cupin domain-containing protein [Pusillimonas sp. TS35]
MNTNQPLDLLGGLAPEAFMRRYWQRQPLLIRQAIPGFKPSLSMADIRQLVRREEVESRLIWRDQKGWNMKHGPLARLPAAGKPDWTALAQSVDLHDDATAELMHQFRFISDARLDDAMVSIAGPGGGVGPHFDSYDVFLLQAHGRRRWRISRQRDLTLEPGLPLKILRHFEAEEEYVLEPGDMLYLPPHVAHDGVALDECMTISIGFRAATQAALACGMLEAANDRIMASLGESGGLYASPALPGPVLSAAYKDAGEPATAQPAELPARLIGAALDAASKIRFDERLATRFLGVWLTDPSPNALFEPGDSSMSLADGLPADGALALDRCTRMMYRDKQLFINGEVAPVAASAALRRLADQRTLECASPLARRLSVAEREMLDEWLEDGWLHFRNATSPTR